MIIQPAAGRPQYHPPPTRFTFLLSIHCDHCGRTSHFFFEERPAIYQSGFENWRNIAHECPTCRKKAFPVDPDTILREGQA